MSSRRWNCEVRTMSSDVKIVSVSIRSASQTVKMEGIRQVLRGYSAYEIAVQNGFTGSEEEWLASLAGKLPDQIILDGGNAEGLTKQN